MDREIAGAIGVSGAPAVQNDVDCANAALTLVTGAALDVFDIEPLPADHPFRSLDNVLATPHIGFVARELYRTFYSDTVKNIMRWLAQQ